MSGSGSSSGSGFPALELDPDDEPTKPDGIADPHALGLVRTYGNMSPPVRKRLNALVMAYASCSAEDQITIEMVARRLALIP